jgi:hypothetical protein
MPSYDINSLYFHWDILESDNYVCKVEEYEGNDVKLFRLTDGTQHCKIWFTNDGINIIPIWFKRLLLEYVIFY